MLIRSFRGGLDLKLEMTVRCLENLTLLSSSNLREPEARVSLQFQFREAYFQEELAALDFDWS
jgi:hypothetical protein